MPKLPRSKSASRLLRGQARGQHNHARLQRLNEEFRRASLPAASTLTQAEPIRKQLRQKQREELQQIGDEQLKSLKRGIAQAKAGEQKYIGSFVAHAISNERLIAAVRAWQADKHIHPLTCGNKSSHALLEPKVGADEAVYLSCPDCDYSQSLNASLIDLLLAHKQVKRRFQELREAMPSERRARNAVLPELSSHKRAIPSEYDGLVEARKAGFKGTKRRLEQRQKRSKRHPFDDE